MTPRRNAPTRWQFGLREMFVVVTCVAITVSFAQFPLFYPFVPLVFVICFELCGWRTAASVAARATLVLWLGIPLIVILVGFAYG